MWRKRSTRRSVERELARLRSEFENIYDGVMRSRPSGGLDRYSLASVTPWIERGMALAPTHAVRDVAKAASRGAGLVSHQLEDVYDMAVGAVRKRPLPAGLALLAFGIVLGLATRKAMSA